MGGFPPQLGAVLGSQGVQLVQDLSTGNLIIVTAEHNQIHKGNLYGVGVVSTGIAILTPKRFLLVTPNTSTRAHLVYEVETQPGATVELYEGTTTSSDGTALSEICHRRASPNVATVVATEDPTVTADGTLLVTQSSGTATLGGKVGTVTSRASEFVLAQNTKYQIKITALAASTTVSILMEWYEI